MEEKKKKMLIIGAVVVVVIVVALVVAFSGKGNNTTTQKKGQTTGTTQTTEDKKEEEQGTQAQQVKLGETTENDYIKMTLDKFEVEQEYKFKYTEKTTVGTHIKNNGIDGKSGMKLVCLRGKLTNKTSQDVYTSNNFIKGEMTINGNTYKTTLKCFDTEHAESYLTVVAQQETEYFLYAEVPQNVADNIETCTISFGWVKDLDSRNTAFADKMTDLDYLYTLKTK